MHLVLCYISCWDNQGMLRNYGVDLSPETLRGGHLRVRLRVLTMKYRHVFVHHLVLEAFVEMRPVGLISRHLDGNPANNHFENLCWGTHKENEEDRKRHGTDPTGERNPAAILTEDDVREIRRVKKKVGDKKRSNIELSERFGVSCATIKDIVCGRSWRHVL